MIESTETAPLATTQFARRCWAALGVLAVGVGTVGVFLPGLPTTIFLLAACYCYARGNPEAVQRLREHRIYGRYLSAFTANGFTWKARVAALATMWAMIAVSAAMFVAFSPFAAAALVVAGGGGTACILLWN